MDSKRYILDWDKLENEVQNRMKDGSLVHTFTSKKKIAESTKLFNKNFKKFSRIKSYSVFVQRKKNILDEQTENTVVTDESELSEDDYKRFYNSFSDLQTKDAFEENFYWNEAGREYFDTPSCDRELIVSVTVAEESDESTNVKKVKKRQTLLKKVQTKSNSLVKKAKNKSNQSPNLSNDGNNDSDVTTNGSINKDTNINNKNAVKKTPIAKKVKESSISKKTVDKKSSRDVKRNLTSVINSVDANAAEPFDENDWNDEFVPSDFRAQSTQIYSDTFSEVIQKQKRMSCNKFKLPQNEITNQPRDSGIEEDSREDNINNESLVDHKKVNNKKVDNAKDKISKNKEHKNRESNLEHESEENNLKINDGLPNSDIDSINKQNEICNTQNKKRPLKIREEKITKKYTIIGKRDTKLKPVEEETLLSKSDNENKCKDSINEKAKQNNESEIEFMGAQNSKITENIKEEEESNDEYYDLRDYGSEENSNDENNFEFEKGISVATGVQLKKDNRNESENKQDKTKSKDKIKHCKSPYLVQKYEELQKLGLLTDSQEESECESVDVKSITNDGTFVAKNKNKSVEDDAVFSKYEQNGKHKVNNKNNIDDLSNDDNIDEVKNKEDANRENSEDYGGNDNTDSSDNEYNNEDDLKRSIENIDKMSQNVKNRHQAMKNLDTSTPNSKKCQKDENIISNTTSPQSSQKSSKYSSTEKKTKKFKKMEKEEMSSSHEESYEIEKQEEFTNVVENYKQSLDSKEKNNANMEERISLDTQKRYQQINNLDLIGSDQSESSEEENHTIDHKSNEKLSTNRKNIKTKIDKRKGKSFNSSESDDTSEDYTILSDIKKRLHKVSNGSEKINDIDPDDSSSNIDIEEHKISIPDEVKEPEAIKNLDENSSSSNVINNKHVSMVKELECNKSDKESSVTSQNIDVEYYSSEAEILNKKKHRTTSETNGKDKKIDVDTLSPKISKRVDLSKTQEDKINDNSGIVNSSDWSDDESDSDENDREMSPTTAERLSHYKKMNLVYSNSSSSEDEDTIVKNKISTNNLVGKNDSLKQINSSDSDSDSKSKKSEKSNLSLKSNKSDIDDLLRNKSPNKHTQISRNNLVGKNDSLKQINSSDSDSDSESRKSEKSNLSLKSNKSDIDDLLRNKSPNKHTQISRNNLVEKSNSLKQTNSSNSDSDSESRKSEKSNLSLKSNKSDINDLLENNSLNNHTQIENHKFDTAKNSKHSKKASETINDSIEDMIKNEENCNKNKHIICETQESDDAESKLQSQEMFSSLEDLTKGIQQNLPKLDEELGMDNNIEIASQMPPIPQPKPINTERIRKISELVEKENLLEGSYESTMTWKDVSPDEEIFILEVPKNVFNEDLIDKKLTFSKTTLMLGNEMYEAFQRKVSPIYSCVFKSEKNTKNSFKTFNIRPTVEIVAPRRKQLDDSNKQANLESDEDNEKSEISSRTSENIHTVVKSEDKSSIKTHKKKSKKSDEIKSENRKVSKKESRVTEVDTTHNKFALKNFVSRSKTKRLNNINKIEEDSILKKNSSVDSDNDSIKDEKDNKIFDDISNNVKTQLKKHKTSIKKVKNSDLHEEMDEKKIETESQLNIHNVNIESGNPFTVDTNTHEGNEETNQKLKLSMKIEKKSKNKVSSDNKVKLEIEKESKPKKLKLKEKVLSDNECKTEIKDESKPKKLKLKEQVSSDNEFETEIKDESKPKNLKLKEKVTSDNECKTEIKDESKPKKLKLKEKVSSDNEYKTEIKDESKPKKLKLKEIVSSDNEFETEIKDESKPKKLKSAITDATSEINEAIAGPSSDPPPKKSKSSKKIADGKPKSVKRKAKDQTGEGAMKKVKKAKVAKENKAKATTKTTTKSKKTKKKGPTAGVAVKEIMDIIEKTMKFNQEKIDESNSSMDSSKYGALDVERVPAKKRYESTTSSSDDDKKYIRRSFQVREKPKLEDSDDDDKDLVKPSTSSQNDLVKTDMKTEDEKTKKKRMITFDD